MRNIGSNTNTTNLPINYFSSLGEELFRIAKALTKVSQKLQEISSIQTVKVTPKTDPEMFSDEFLKTIRQSRREFEKGSFDDYLTFRKTLDL